MERRRKKATGSMAKALSDDKMLRARIEIARLRRAVVKELKWKPLKPIALRNIIASLQNMEKPTKASLDKISLLAGFQDWDSFQRALQGRADADVNYKQSTDNGDDNRKKPTDKDKDSK